MAHLITLVSSYSYEYTGQENITTLVIGTNDAIGLAWLVKNIQAV